MRSKKFDSHCKKISEYNFKNKKINKVLSYIDTFRHDQERYFNELKVKMNNIESMVGELEVNKKDDEMENNDFRSDKNHDRAKKVRYVKTLLRKKKEKEDLKK